MERLVIGEVERVLRHQCAALDPDSVPLPEAPDLYLQLVAIRKLADGAATRLLARVDEARPAASSGDRSTADWAARRSGTSPGAAKDRLETSKRLGDQPSVDEALARGELSGEQANAVSGAAGADPTAEKRLLDEARNKTVKDLKKECDRVKANAHPNPEARRAAIHRDRHVRTWRDAEGGWNLKMRHLPEVGAEIEAEIARYAHAAFERARKEARRESSDAYRADGVVDLIRAHAAARRAGTRAGSPPATNPPAPASPEPIAPVLAPKGASLAETKTFVHVDLETLLRGRTVLGSICHIDGIGPVDLDWIAGILGDTFVAVLVKDGESIREVIHLGRKANALQRSALEARGYQCERPGCDSTTGLEIDHIDDWADTHQTVLDKLAWLCPREHDLKTHHGYRLTGPPGERIWWHPDGSIIAMDRPPPSSEAARSSSQQS